MSLEKSKAPGVVPKVVATVVLIACIAVARAESIMSRACVIFCGGSLGEYRGCSSGAERLYLLLWRNIGVVAQGQSVCFAYIRSGIQFPPTPLIVNKTANFTLWFASLPSGEH